MGMYTEINVCFDLRQDVSMDVVGILHALIDDVELPSLVVLPKHEFFRCDRWKMVCCCGSYYFDGLTHSIMSFDMISKTWKVNIRANLKNYDSEIEKFLDWLVPYIKTCGFIGYARYEEFDDPTLVYIEDHKVVFKQI